MTLAAAGFEWPAAFAVASLSVAFSVLCWSMREEIQTWRSLRRGLVLATPGATEASSRIR